MSELLKWLTGCPTTVRWIVLVFLVAVVSLGTAAAVAWRRRDAPAANWFATLTGTLALGAAVIGATVATPLPRPLLFWMTVTVGLAVPIPWLFFCLSYTGRSEFISPGLATIVSIVPVTGLIATSVIFGTQVLPGLRLPAQRAATGMTALLVAVLNIAQWLALFYAGGLVFVGAGLLLWTFHRYDYLDSTTGVLSGTLGTVPWLSIVFGLQLVGTAPRVLSGTVGIGLFVGGLVAIGAVGPRRLFDRIPAAVNVGPGTVVKDLPDPVVVTDSTETVVDLNRIALQTLRSAGRPTIGAGVTEVLGSAVETLRGDETVELPVGPGRRLFAPTVSELTDQHGHQLGYAIVLRDVTERAIRQQRLEVFNRVLRHNLRNKMTVALGSAESILDAVDDPEIGKPARSIVRVARELTALSEQAREIEQVMAGAGAENETAPLTTLVEAVLQDVDQAGVTLTHDLPAGVTIEESPGALQLALVNLVENAIEHNDASDPVVELRAGYEAGRQYPLSISVEDNGPGLPDHEVRAVEAGSESALEHGSGLGLWVVRWVAMQFQGEVEFRDRDPRGTVVEMRLGSGVAQHPDHRSASPVEDVTRS